ncbi:MAG: DinB family protein [Chloroflexota bacterium]|nr:DinB family protein [Chloroflexota bacterium]
MNRRQLLDRLDTAWQDFTASYAGMSDVDLMEPGVTGGWSVRDIIAHVTTWDEESLTHLPTIAAGGRTPRYATRGGIDAFDAPRTEQFCGLSLAEVRERQEETHRRLLVYLQDVPDVLITWETRFRRRQRLDTYGHYPLHAAAIRAWREHWNGG